MEYREHQQRLHGCGKPGPSQPGASVSTRPSGNLDLVRPLELDAVDRATLVLGSEFRVEYYRIEAGQFESYSLGNGDPGDIPKLTAGVDYDTTVSGGLKAAGSQVFGGFRPAREVDRYRNSISAYAGLENQVSEMLTVDVGGRVDQFSDFGSTASGKLAMSLVLQ